METLQKAKQFFSEDKFQKLVGVEIEEVQNGHSVCVLKLNQNHFNADGLVQGGVLFTLADSAFAIAANSTDCFVVTLSTSMQYMTKATGNFIKATATLVNTSKHVCFYRVEIVDEVGALVAVANMTGYIKKR